MLIHRAKPTPKYNMKSTMVRVSLLSGSMGEVKEYKDNLHMLLMQVRQSRVLLFLLLMDSVLEAIPSGSQLRVST